MERISQTKGFFWHSLQFHNASPVILVLFLIGLVYITMNINTTKYKNPILLKGDYSHTTDFNRKSNYQPLPAPRPKGDLRLDLLEYLPHLKDSKEIRLHLVGDTGSFKNLEAQAAIAGEIVSNAKKGKGTDFLYHLGDIVYHHGEASEYPSQFLTPYAQYPGPIFAIAGNHDGDVRMDAPEPYESLAPFMQVFCSKKKGPIPFAVHSKRKSVTQPYVYWSLNTPVANIIGLYGNVAKFGLIDEEQRKWFIEALKQAAVEKEHKALFIAIHQSPFSADINHGSSLYMIDFLDAAFEEANVLPDAVFSGHVHNYQRFHKRYGPDKVVPYIVAGAGGYAILHSVAEKDNALVTDQDPRLNSVSLESFCDSQHGYLRLSMKRKREGIQIKGTYYTVQEDLNTGRMESKIFDQFKIKIDRFEEVVE